MKLYKLTSNKSYEKTMFILAENKPKAIAKYYSILEIGDNSYVSIELICRRDEIVPTVEPAVEFLKQ